MLATLGQLTEFRVAFNGSRGTVTLIFGDRRRKRTRRKKPCVPGAVKGGPKPEAVFCATPSPARSFQGVPKPVAKSPGTVPSGNLNPASPTRMNGKESRQKYLTFASPPLPSVAGISSFVPTTPVEPPVTAVEPPVTVVVPVKQVAQKRKASSPFAQDCYAPYQPTIADMLGVNPKPDQGEV